MRPYKIRINNFLKTLKKDLYYMSKDMLQK